MVILRLTGWLTGDVHANHENQNDDQHSAYDREFSFHTLGRSSELLTRQYTRVVPLTPD